MQGKFFYCTDSTKKAFTECHGVYYVFDGQAEMPRQEERAWKRRDFNYDNIVQALLTLFVITTGEGWPE